MSKAVAARHALPRKNRRKKGTGSARGKWKLRFSAVLVALLVLVGMSAALYPSTAAWWSQYNQSKLIRDYADQIKKDPPPGNAVALAQAEEYNTMLSSGALLAAGERLPKSDSADAATNLDYWRLLSATSSGIMGRIRIPSITVDLPIYHGTSDETLAKGVGHLQGTSLPVGGIGTRTVLTAHTGLASATLFNNLNKVKVGDTFTLEIFGRVLTYEVFDTQIVDPDDTEAILAVPDQDLATLVTCTPLGINTHRILVTGKRVTPTPEADVAAAMAPPDIPGFPWWIVIGSAGILAVGAYIWWSGYPAKPRKKKPSEGGKEAQSAKAADEVPVSGDATNQG